MSAAITLPLLDGVEASPAAQAGFERMPSEGADTPKICLGAGANTDEAGMRRLFRQFSFPGGIPSHVAPETPGSIHEGGELGYSLSHAFGAAFDNPDQSTAGCQLARADR